MVILIAGATHTGKTLLAQKLVETYHFPALSIDHLKMGLIRSGNTALTPQSPHKALEVYLWPIVCEMVKTTVENRQNLIVEGCYIPFTYAQDFDAATLPNIRAVWLVFSQVYIHQHYDDILRYESVVEHRSVPEDVTKAALLEENAHILAACQKHGLTYILVDDHYDVNLTL